MPKPPHTTFNEHYEVAGRPKPPSVSWWINLPRQDFSVQMQRELPRMRGSKEAEAIRPLTLGGALP